MENIPTVLETIYKQTIPPKLVVLNLAYNEQIPTFVKEYINYRHIEIQYVEDTKVYKKILPTLKKYPFDNIICIDDDWLYPPTMIEDFLKIHNKYPNYPISGNKVVIKGRQCHCGCASLVRADFFGDKIYLIDDEVMHKCTSSDIVYTYLATLNNHPYITTEYEYFDNMQSYNSVDGYSENNVGDNGVEDSFEYLEKRFGKLPSVIESYLSNTFVPIELITKLLDIQQQNYYYIVKNKIEHQMQSSIRYKIGDAVIKPYKLLKKILKRYAIFHSQK
ncbi:MAG: hypothetical protein IJ756_00915 [Paludibacteraceae bacterium]|nr:hypothetical protein [Paludibacteraceae bacterium]